MTTVYKVVNINGDQFTSVATPPKYRITYTVGKVATPPIGYLYAFKGIEDAFELWAWNKSGCRIMFCEAEVHVASVKIAVLGYQIEDFWRTGGLNGVNYGFPSSCYCKWIKPLGLI